MLERCAKCPVFPVCVLFGPEIAHIVLEMMEAKLKTEQQAAKTEGTDSPKEF